MSESDGGRHETSKLASMFGFVTEEDRDRWDRVRISQRTQGAAKAGAKGTMDALVRNVERRTTSQMRAADQVAANEAHDVGRGSTARSRWNPKTRRLEDVIESAPRDTRKDLDPDFDFEA